MLHANYFLLYAGVFVSFSFVCFHFYKNVFSFCLEFLNEKKNKFLQNFEEKKKLQQSVFELKNEIKKIENENVNNFAKQIYEKYYNENLKYSFAQEITENEQKAQKLNHYNNLHEINLIVNLVFEDLEKKSEQLPIDYLI